MLNLIKNIWDLPNIVYLVSYDKKNISRILENAFDNKDYIEKIVNIERFLPINTTWQKLGYFNYEFTNILFRIYFRKDVLPFDFDNLKESLIGVRPKFYKNLINYNRKYWWEWTDETILF